MDTEAIAVYGHRDIAVYGHRDHCCVWTLMFLVRIVDKRIARSRSEYCVDPDVMKKTSTSHPKLKSAGNNCDKRLVVRTEKTDVP